MKRTLLVLLTLSLSAITLISCSSDESLLLVPDAVTDEDPTENPSDAEDEGSGDDGGDTETSPVDGLEVFDPDAVDPSLILVNDASANRVYLMNKATEVVFEWDLGGKRLGNDVFLMPDGRLLANLEDPNPQITLGGFGGLIEIIDAEGNVDWSYTYSDTDRIAHHDAEMLPNGNILFMAWIRRSPEDAAEIGYQLGTEIVYDALIEVDPDTNEIVWEWHAWDHFIQERDATRAKFGTVADNPQRIDVNYVTEPDVPGDVTHANGIAYDAEKDVIYISVNFYSEIWVIDHSTTTEEAKGDSGGNFGKGGGLLYRFGNPEAYDNPAGTRRFDRNHFPNLLDGAKKGRMLVFANGRSAQRSTAYELELPGTFAIEPSADNEPLVTWSFSDPGLFSEKVSGVVELPNGNRLITEGDFGFWEVDNSGQVVWRFGTQGFFWRAYAYEQTAPEIQALGLTF